MRLTFRGSPSIDGPRAVNLNIYEGRRQMGFGGFTPTSTSSAFVVVGPGQYCSPHQRNESLVKRKGEAWWVHNLK